jgi:hypothetical protein
MSGAKKAIRGPITLRNHTVIMSALSAKVNKGRPFAPKDFLDHNTIAAIDNHLALYPISTQKAYLWAIIAFLEAGDADIFKPTVDYFRAKADVAAKAFIVEHDKQERSKAEIKNWATMAELHAVRNTLLEKYEKKKTGIFYKDCSSLQRLLVLSLYLFVPPLRCDYATMLILRKPEDDDQKSNYVDIANKKFILRTYKTAKNYGTKELSFDHPVLAPLILLWTSLNPTPYFLVAKLTKFKDSPYKQTSPANLSLFVISVTKKYLSRAVGPAMIRKIYLTEKYPEMVPREAVRRSADAEYMLHSKGTQINTYRKFAAE